MDDPGPRRGRMHDAEGARRAILDAAEEVFAEHGFDGARIDTIATVAGYNKSLIFQYFGNKLNLYAQVLRVADKDLSEQQAHMFAALLEDETIVSDARKFRTWFATVVQGMFDYLAVHPRLWRMILWEMAEGWQTYAEVLPQMEQDDIERFKVLFQKAYSAGLIRSDFSVVAQLTLVIQICLSYLAWIPVYQMLLPGEDFSSEAAHARAREFVVSSIVSSIVIDLPEMKT